MTSSPAILHLVDSIEYARSNCFQHQLYNALEGVARVEHCALNGLERALDWPGGPRPIVCCLKQRTLFRETDRIAALIGRTPIVVYDQDPWEAFRDGSPFKGTYERAMEKLNVKSFAVTTQLWADFLFHRKIPSTFVRMWVQPEYCDLGMSYEDRPVQAGFVGALHPYRRALFDALDDLDTPVQVQTGGLPYREFMLQLSNLRVYVHAEDAPVVVDGDEMNLRDALWIKDIEAMARGCFCIRNAGAGSTSYTQSLPIGPDGNRLLRLFKRPSDVPRLLADIEKMDPGERQSLINRTVESIRGSAVWQETASTLVQLATGAQ